MLSPPSGIIRWANNFSLTCSASFAKTYFMVVTRFAPSPTGMLHIGAARTPYFNWLFARRHKGKYLLRLEDTDKARSTTQATASILEGLKWLGIEADEPPVYQSQRAGRHLEVAQTLLTQNKAYKCYASVEELAQMRAEQKAKGLPLGYDGRWRTRSDAPKGVAPTIRFAAPRSGSTTIEDSIQGKVDGTPTYMLAVAVDDYDMGVTHVIRGDDHLTNSFRQLQLLMALEAKPPQYAHMPLLHGKDGAKLSKRHGASGVEDWRSEGFLAAALLNYLVRLGWSYKNEEIISQQQAANWFSLEAVGKSPARLDEEKLRYLNGYYLRNTPAEKLLEQLKLYADFTKMELPNNQEQLLNLVELLKVRTKTLKELAQKSAFLKPIATHKIKVAWGKILLEEMTNFKNWQAKPLEDFIRKWLEANELALKEVAQPLRLALTGSEVSPPIFAVMELLGKAESLARLNRAFA